LDHPNVYSGDEQSVKDRFSPNVIAEQYETLFNQLLQD
ncbi:unnamed protein product, partial [marine sediment metagenome]